LNLKKNGQRLLLLTFLILFVTGWLDMTGMWRLTLGAFGFGAAFILIFSGGIKPPEE